MQFSLIGVWRLWLDTWSLDGFGRLFRGLAWLSRGAGGNEIAAEDTGIYPRGKEN